MAALHSIPEPTLDPAFLALVRAAGDSPERARDAALAAAGDCPAPEDVVRLQQGRLADEHRRRALARHLVSCPRCGGSNLGALLRAENVRDGSPATAGRTLRSAGLARVAAAAALLLAGLVGVRSGLEAERLAGAWPVDAYGLELRQAPAEPSSRRVLVRAEADGHLALVRRSATAIRIEAVEGTARTVPVRKGEEVVLPLDRALEIPAAEDWLVLHLSSPPTDAALEALAVEVVRGAHPTGVDVLRFPVAKTRP